MVTIDSAAYNATFDTKNVGTAKPVTVTGVTLSGADAGNYTVAQPAGLTADITALELTVAGATADNKVYDGTTDATVTFTVRGAGRRHRSRRRRARHDGLLGFLRRQERRHRQDRHGHRPDPGRRRRGQLHPRPARCSRPTSPPKTVTGAFTADNKVYDGTTDATVATRSLVGTITGDVVTLSGGTATFADQERRHGQDRHPDRCHASAAPTPATTSWRSVGDHDRRHHRQDRLTGAVAADEQGLRRHHRRHRPLARSAGRHAARRHRDPESAAPATFADKNVGTGKTVTVTGATLGGADAGNYTLSATADHHHGRTSPHSSITGSFAAGEQGLRRHHRRHRATARSVAGTLTGDVVTLSGGTATFADKNVGTGKTVTADRRHPRRRRRGQLHPVGTPTTTTANITAKLDRHRRLRLGEQGLRRHHRRHRATGALS